MSKADKGSARLPRVVLDTAVLLKALLLNGAEANQVRQGWQEGRYMPLIDGLNAQVLMRSLAYPELRLSEEQQHELLADFLPYAEVVAQGRTTARNTATAALDLCLAKAAKADLLVSDCKAIRAEFARRVSPSGKALCQVLGSQEFLRTIAFETAWEQA